MSSQSIPLNTFSNDVPVKNNTGIFEILQKRRLIILAFTLLSVCLSLIYVSGLKNTHISTTKVMVTSGTIPNRSNILQTLRLKEQLNGVDLLSQIQIMQSPDVLRRLIVSENLFFDPEFGGSTSFVTFTDLVPARQQAIMSRVKSSIAINHVKGTSIIDVSVEASNPEKAARIANALVKSYVENEISKSKETAHLTTEWLADRLEIMRNDLQEAETALDAALEKNNLAQLQSGDSRLTRIELLNKQLAFEQSEYAETQAILDLMNEAKRQNKRLDTIPQYLSGRLTESLKESETRLLQTQASLKKRYGPNHPKMIAFNAEFNAFKDKLNTEIVLFRGSLENQAKIKILQIDKIQSQIDTYLASYRGDAEKRLRIKNLESQANTSRTMLDNFMATYLESLQSLNINNKPIRVISEALPLNHSSLPRKWLVIILSGLTGLFLGLFVALILERVQNVIQNPQQLDNFMEIPLYATLPKVKLLKGQNVVDYILSQPASAWAELVRSMYSSIQLRDPHQKSGGRVITVTSTHSDEGKTTISMALATAAAQNGKKVLIVDTDMRRPSLHKAYGLGNAKGLADYLSNRFPLDDTIYKNHSSGVHIMTSKAIPTHALTLLGGDRMETLIRRVRDMYDLIILDSPTSFVFSDARVLAKLSDKTMYVVEWKKTKQDDIKQTIKQFLDMSYDNISFVLNKVDDKKIINFGKAELAYMGAINT